MAFKAALAAFSAANPAERFDFLSALLRACSPHEVRAAGLLVEDLGSINFGALLQQEGLANDATHVLSMATEIGAIQAAHQLYQYVPLLSRFNFPVSAIMTKILLQLPYHTQDPQSKHLCTLCQAVFTMCIAHPAFTVAQKSTLHAKFHSCQADTTLSVISAVITGIRREAKAYYYAMDITWSNGTTIQALRSYNHFFEFQCKLVDMFSSDKTRVVPFLPGKQIMSIIMKSKNEIAASRAPEIQVYLDSLLRCPPRISRCDHVIQFFSSCARCGGPTAECPGRCTRISSIPEDGAAPVRGLTVDMGAGPHGVGMHGVPEAGIPLQTLPRGATAIAMPHQMQPPVAPHPAIMMQGPAFHVSAMSAPVPGPMPVPAPGPMPAPLMIPTGSPFLGRRSASPGSSPRHSPLIDAIRLQAFQPRQLPMMSPNIPYRGGPGSSFPSVPLDPSIASVESGIIESSLCELTGSALSLSSRDSDASPAPPPAAQRAASSLQRTISAPDLAAGPPAWHASTHSLNIDQTEPAPIVSERTRADSEVSLARSESEEPARRRGKCLLCTAESHDAAACAAPTAAAETMLTILAEAGCPAEGCSQDELVLRVRRLAWLKHMRLHKYAARLLPASLATATEDQLQALGMQAGAAKKFCAAISESPWAAASITPTEPASEGAASPVASLPASGMTPSVVGHSPAGTATPSPDRVTPEPASPHCDRPPRSPHPLARAARASCFNCGEEGHLGDACLGPRPERDYSLRYSYA
eukprot:m.24924 g.24924  ORF g.24924 m.24924 type:complete len:754 (+) comp4086_c0_seq1:44-2305(+)